ncbi:LOW QUALITY PROTEIN: hypothetical protein Cgig2_021215 [Carnegiea gigantea]|uniref:Cytochrome P450 n=1 Tax=Carnegiea gigantea TaxID=171969 RepID=A0A9Q1KWC0_9CARY|nr:LOW QUALITY PROTEIN: hypothetical protein Cgig2_021215 [Carnegiea gigantea]
MKRNFRKLDDILQRWLDEHKQKRSEDDQDIMDVMLQVIDHKAIKNYNYDVDTMIITSGSDTNPISLTWAILLLLSNPYDTPISRPSTISLNFWLKWFLSRAQDELATKERIDKLLNQTFLASFTLLLAIVKETMRLYRAALFLVREFIKGSIVSGYNVETGTKLMVNIHQIFRVPQIWEDPLDFRPERFLTTHKDVDFKGKHFEFIPFGAGRRACPGVSFGLKYKYKEIVGPVS